MQKETQQLAGLQFALETFAKLLFLWGARGTENKGCGLLFMHGPMNIPLVVLVVLEYGKLEGVSIRKSMTRIFTSSYTLLYITSYFQVGSNCQVVEDNL